MAHPQCVGSEESNIPCRHDLGWISHARASHDDLGASMTAGDVQQKEAQYTGRCLHDDACEIRRINGVTLCTWITSVVARNCW